MVCSYIGAMSAAHVLVVDDEVDILTALRRVLMLEGYDVDVAGGMGVAEERLAKSSYDIALFDVALPDGDGVTLLERVRRANLDLPVIMMSGHATIGAAVRATRLGAIDFLEKPLSTDRLLLVIQNALRLVKAEQETKELRIASGQDQTMIGSSRAIQQLREQIARAARASVSVLVLGERGTGKELVARALHQASPRAGSSLEKLNCAAVPKELIESELFGHEAGAFTGATRQRRGKFERATRGTLFLDEVGDMPLDMQAKLLRVLQEQEIERVGGNETIKIDVRVVAATNRDLVDACKQGLFRADLYDRLNVLPLVIPPLRARREDIPELTQHFLRIAAHNNARPGMRMEPDAVNALQAHSWPGNVRELRNIIERLVILSPDDVIGADDVQRCLGHGVSTAVSGLFRAGVPFRVLCEEAERTIISEALQHFSGQMAATARGLGLERSHFYKKCKALGLRGEETG